MPAQGGCRCTAPRGVGAAAPPVLPSRPWPSCPRAADSNTGVCACMPTASPPTESAPSLAQIVLEVYSQSARVPYHEPRYAVMGPDGSMRVAKVGRTQPPPVMSAAMGRPPCGTRQQMVRGKLSALACLVRSSTPQAAPRPRAPHSPLGVQPEEESEANSILASSRRCLADGGMVMVIAENGAFANLRAGSIATQVGAARSVELLAPPA